MQHYFSQPYRQHYPSLRVTNPSLPTPGPAPEKDVKHTQSTAPQEGPCLRPAGYTSSAPWLRGEDAGYFNIERTNTIVLPNPHAMHHDEDGHTFDTIKVREVPPLRIEKRAFCTPVQLQDPPISNAATNTNRRFVGTHGQEMRMIQSQPSSVYSGYSMFESPMAPMPPTVQNHSSSGYPMARSSALSSSVVREYNGYPTRPHCSSRNARTPHHVTSAQSILSSRPALRLDVHGLSLVEEHSETSFAPAGYSQNNGLYARADARNSFAPVLGYSRGTDLNLREMGIQPTPMQDPLRHAQAEVKFPNHHERYTPVITRQPRRQKNMRVLVGSRNPKGLPYAADGTREWSTDLCLFCDHNMNTWCKALWCPCIIYGRNKARIENLYAEEKVHPNRGGMCSADCALHACLTTFCLFGWAIQVPNRASVRRRYNIDGDWLGDCAAAFFCSPCELSQESRELDLEEQSFGNPVTWVMRER